MKTLATFAIILVVLLSFSFSQSTLTLQTIANPWMVVKSPSYPTLNSLYFLSATEAWIVGDSGTIFHTTNRGEYWAKIQTGISTNLKSVYFTDPQNGYVSGDGFIYDTHDGGVTWHYNYIGENINNFYFDPQSANIGYAVAKEGSVFYTQDSGNIWTILTTTDLNLNNIVINQAPKGFITSSFFTTGGGSWTYTQVIYPPGVYSASTTFPAYGGVLFSTQNNDTYWSGGIGINMLDDIKFLDPNIGWISASQITTYHISQITDYYANSGPSYYSYGHYDFTYDVIYYLFRTTNGGNSLLYSPIFSETNVSQPGYIHITFPNQNTGYAAEEGSNIFYQTKDGGISWSLISAGSPYFHLKGIYFVTDSIGWVIGSTVSDSVEIGMILYTQDGGVHWNIQSPQSGFSPTMPLNSISFGSDGVGWLAGGGNNALQYTSSDNGYSWKIKSNINCYGNQLIAFNQDTVYLVGNSLLMTTDGGQTWNSISPPHDDLNYEFYDTLHLQFINSTTVWGGGFGQVTLPVPVYPSLSTYFPTLTRSMNQGSTWTYTTTFSNLTDTQISSLYFKDSSRGWALPQYYQNPVSTAQFLFYTANGGVTWTQQYLPMANQFLDYRCMTFNTISTGWLCDGHGDILDTNDSGSTWNYWGNANNQPLNKIYFLTPQIGWTIGNYGTMLQTIDGGNSWQYLEPITSSNLNYIAFTPNGTGYIVGDNGTMLRLFPGVVGPTSVPKKYWELME